MGLSASFTVKIRFPKWKQFRGNLRKQSILIISKLDTKKLNNERNSNHILKDEIKAANIAGTNDRKRSGNKEHRMICVLFHAPKAGFTYAAGEERTCL